MTTGTHSPCTAAWWRPPSKPGPNKVRGRKELGCKPFQLGQAVIAIPKNSRFPAMHLASDGAAVAAGWVTALCFDALECRIAYHPIYRVVLLCDSTQAAC